MSEQEHCLKNFVLAGMLSIVMAIFVCVPAKAAGGLVDGEYDCGGGYTYRAMGKVDVRNGQFRYRPFGDTVNGFAPYSVDGSGKIIWGGPFGGLDDAPAQIVSANREVFGFNVLYRGSVDGLVQTMSCHAPGK